MILALWGRTSREVQPLYDTLKTILTDYPRAKNEPLAGHPLGSFIRHDAATAVEALFVAPLVRV
jgi:hypothetical protein